MVKKRKNGVEWCKNQVNYDADCIFVELWSKWGTTTLKVLDTLNFEKRENGCAGKCPPLQLTASNVIIHIVWHHLHHATASGDCRMGADLWMDGTRKLWKYCRRMDSWSPILTLRVRVIVRYWSKLWWIRICKRILEIAGRCGGISKIQVYLWIWTLCSLIAPPILELEHSNLAQR